MILLCAQNVCVWMWNKKIINDHTFSPHSKRKSIQYNPLLKVSIQLKHTKFRLLNLSFINPTYTKLSIEDANSYKMATQNKTNHQANIIIKLSNTKGILGQTTLLPTSPQMHIILPSQYEIQYKPPIRNTYNKCKRFIFQTLQSYTSQNNNHKYKCQILPSPWNHTDTQDKILNFKII